MDLSKTFKKLSLNLLKLKAVYVLNRQYEILVTTLYFNVEYYQKVRITIQNAYQLPFPLIE